MNTSFSARAAFLLAMAGISCMVQAADAPVQGTPATVGSTGCPSDAALSPLQRRLLDKYDQDPAILMQYVWRTRNIYLLDRMETALWAEANRNTHPGC